MRMEMERKKLEGKKRNKKNMQEKTPCLMLSKQEQEQEPNRNMQKSATGLDEFFFFLRFSFYPRLVEEPDWDVVLRCMHKGWIELEQGEWRVIQIYK